MSKMRGAEAFVKALEKEGVQYVFGHPGHGNMNILDAIYDSEQIAFKLVRHELAAAHIAASDRHHCADGFLGEGQYPGREPLRPRPRGDRAR